MVLILFLYMLLASTFTLGKALLFYLQPLFCIGVRMLISGILLLGYSYVRGFQFRATAQTYWLLAQVILFHIYIAFVFEFWAMQYTSSIKAALIFNLSPFATAFVAFIAERELLSKQKVVGLLIGLVGMIPLFWVTSQCETPVELPSGFSWPELALICAVIAGSYGWILVARLMKRHSVTPILTNGIGMFGGGLLSLISSLLFETYPYWHPTVRCVEGPSVLNSPHLSPIVAIFLYMGALILIANILVYNIYGYLLARYSATFLSFAGFSCSLFAALFGWLFLGESLSWGLALAFVFIVIGLFIFYKDELNNKKALG